MRDLDELKSKLEIIIEKRMHDICQHICQAGADLGGGCRGAHPPEMKLSSSYIRSRF